ncbi:ligase-associated DNA damage response DEXH box helicase [Pseudochelatococcus contaminans]|uniref:ATP-dependent Lhr-like helicase n=1 Tax=Pseudochelatococcus contaminans TaxID=1538103 RepID=A0A7W5Z202_9HYPH|nr:ATP-dependent Lhr-like helicase [Pseudochelatococcus contaminans]
MTRGRFDAPLTSWFESRGWKPAPFQRKVWRHWIEGRSGLLVTPTGSGKTLAAFGGTLLGALGSGAPARPSSRLRLLWITPLRALAADTVRALREPIAALDLPWTVAMRTGDASARDRRLARQGAAEVLVTTPESLALLLSHADMAERFSGLDGIVVDEWHELLGSKRGVLLQLGLARLRALAPGARIWGLSATLGNLEEARDVLLPHDPDAPIVRAGRTRPLKLETLLPAPGERFPWAGHLGLSQIGRVMDVLKNARTTLFFTNTRAQAELWHRALESVWLDDPSTLALHHGSLDPELRAAAEQGLRDGTVRCVVATSSLDLGVDFPTVDQVLQLGSPKGMARLLQRAGRARHRPGESGHIICVPTHALELAEYAAVRRALAAGRIEAREPPRLSLDVLAQHCVTLALGGGFDAETLFAEVRGTHAFAALSAEQWQTVLAFIVRGGAALENYPDFRRVEQDAQGIFRVTDAQIARRHRLSVGTITSDGSVRVQYLRGGTLGSVEEGFISRMRPGDHFHFAGRALEFVRMDTMTAYVRAAGRRAAGVPHWQGGRMPLSTELGAEVEAVLSGPQDSPEMKRLAPLLDLHRKLSALPGPETLLAEFLAMREGRHLFLYPFAGRATHEGLAALLALRWGRVAPNSFSYAVNDYGLVLKAEAAIDIDADTLSTLFAEGDLVGDLRESLNLGELSRRQFRDIARVAGLLPPSLPGRAARSVRQLQASSGLLFDVLKRYDPGHILLAQAEREVFESGLDVRRLAATLVRCRDKRIDLHRPATLTPLSFPLWTEAIRGQLSTEDWTTRVRRAAERLERRYG